MQIKAKMKNKMAAPEDVFNLFKSVLSLEDKYDKEKEHFWTIVLNARGIIKRIDLISLGSVNASIVSPRETFRPAIIEAGTSVILCHNHPSGDPEPSEADILLTHTLINSGKILDIKVLDHIVIGEDSYFSMKDKKIGGF